MSELSRRQFLKAAAAIAGGAALSLARRLSDGLPAWAQGSDPTPKVYLPYVLSGSGRKHHIYVARNGTPISNVENVIALAGGIQQFVDRDDVVVLKPNGRGTPATPRLCITPSTPPIRTALFHLLNGVFPTPVHRCSTIWSTIQCASAITLRLPRAAT